jgi:hypothetical protein
MAKRIGPGSGDVGKTPIVTEKRDGIARARLIDRIEREIVSDLIREEGYQGQANTFVLAKQKNESWRRLIEDNYVNRSGALCSVANCYRLGTLSRSTRHDEDSEPQWFCSDHFAERHEERKESGIDVQSEIKKLLRAIGKRITE